MARFVLGAMKFQKEVFPEKQELFERLWPGIGFTRFRMPCMQVDD